MLQRAAHPHVIQAQRKESQERSQRLTRQSSSGALSRDALVLSSTSCYAGAYPDSVSIAACRLHINKKKIKLKKLKTKNVSSFRSWLATRLSHPLPQ